MDRHSFIQSKQGVITQTMDDSLNTRQMYNNNNSNNDGDISVAITNGSPICISNPFTLSSSFSLEEEKRKHLPKALSISNHTVNQFDHVGANTTTTVVVVNEPTASSSSSVATSIKRVRSPNPFASKPVISPSSNPFYKPVAPIDLFYQFNSSPKTESMDNHHNGKSIHHPSLLNKPFSNSINNNNNNISKLSRNDSDVSVSNTLPFTINPLSADAISDQSFPRTTKKQRSIPSVPHQVNGTGTEIRPQEALFPFYVCASYGERKTMEDRYSVVGCLGNDPFASLYCVFDGHGGRTAADFCREYMHRHIVQAVNKHKVAAGSETKSIVDFVPTKQSLKDSFVSLDEAFKDTDASPYVGSTALVLLTRENRFWIAHVGDSKALLVRSDGSSEFLTEDHKPSNPIEKARIETCGGRISDNRIEGILAMSRAIGDKIFKGYVTAEPDVNEHELVKAGIHSSIAINATQQTQVFDYAIILGSDGLWDALSPQDAADIVRNAPNLHCANALVAKALESRKNSGASYSHDNVTALVVDLTRMNQERSPIGSTSQGSGPCSPLTSDLNATTQTLLHSSLGSPLALLSPNSTLSSIPGNRHPIFNNIEGNNFTLAFEQSENSSFTASSKPLYQKSVDVNVTQPSQINHVLFQNIISKETNSKMYDISPINDQSAPTISVQNSLNQTDLQDPSINSVPLHMQTESPTLLSSEATSSRVRKQRPKLTIDVRNEDGEIPGAAGGLGS